MSTQATQPQAIATARLALQPLRDEFAPALFGHLNDWEVMRWLASPPWPYRLPDMVQWIAEAQEAHAEGRGLAFAITLSGAPIGCIGITSPGLDPVLGYWLGREFWGHGFMSEAARAVVDHLFAAGHSFLASGVLEGNAASLRIQQKLGFRVVNERYIPAKPHGRPMPHLDTVLGRGHWTKLRCAA